MKNIVIAAIIVLNSLSLWAQAPPSTVVKRFSLTPQKHHLIVNGIAFGVSAHPLELNDTLYTHVNGFNLEVGPMGIIGGLWGTMFGFAGAGFFSGKGYMTARETQYPCYGTRIRGVSVSIGGVGDSFIKGLMINGLSSYNYKVSGVQVTGLVNRVYQSKGVSVAGLVNHATRANGLQIGLINNCRTGKVVQIGLFNRIGKRIVPFVNLRFGKEPYLGEECARRNRKDRVRHALL
jgi:hypothetical protein